MGLLPNLFVVSLVAMSAVWELENLPQSPLPRVLDVALATLALSLIARDYVCRPLMNVPSPTWSDPRDA